MYWKALELFQKGSEASRIFRKVLKGSRREDHKGPGLGGTRPWPAGAQVGRPGPALADPLGES